MSQVVPASVALDNKSNFSGNWTTFACPRVISCRGPNFSGSALAKIFPKERRFAGVHGVGAKDPVALGKIVPAQPAIRRPTWSCGSLPYRRRQGHPQDDQILIDGRDIRQLAANELRTAAASCRKEIARKLGIASSTVKNHLHAIFERLGVSNRTQAADRRPRAGRFLAGENRPVLSGSCF